MGQNYSSLCFVPEIKCSFIHSFIRVRISVRVMPIINLTLTLGQNRHVGRGYAGVCLPVCVSADISLDCAKND